MLKIIEFLSLSLCFFFAVSCNTSSFTFKEPTPAPVSYELKAPFLKQLGISFPTATANDISHSVVPDKKGNSYHVGRTSSSFAETNGGAAGTFDILVIKVNALGEVVWSRQIGTDTIAAYNAANATAFSASANDYASDLVIASNGTLIVGACTFGSLGGTNAGSGDVVLIKMNPDSGEVSWLYQWGSEVAAAESITLSANDCGAIGDNMDQVSLAIDAQDNIFVTSNTNSPMVELNTNDDMYVAKLDINLNFLWVTQYGTATVSALNGAFSAGGGDYPVDIMVTSSGDAILVGYGSSSLGAVNQGLHDMYWSRLNGATGAVQWLQQVGSGAWDVLVAADLDAQENLIFGGWSNSDNLFGSGETNIGWDMFVGKVDTSTGALTWGQTFGTNAGIATGYSFAGQDNVTDVIAHSNGKIYLAGHTTGSLGEAVAGAMDTFLIDINSSNGAINDIHQYGNVSYPGVSAPAFNDLILGIAEGVEGNIYLTGYTDSSFMETNGGLSDIWYLGFHPTTGLP